MEETRRGPSVVMKDDTDDMPTMKDSSTAEFVKFKKEVTTKIQTLSDEIKDIKLRLDKIVTKTKTESTNNLNILER